MPLYCFRCPMCEAEKIVQVPIACRDEVVLDCEACEIEAESTNVRIRMIRVPTPASFVLKGSGFHQNDYPRK